MTNAYKIPTVRQVTAMLRAKSGLVLLDYTAGGKGYRPDITKMLGIGDLQPPVRIGTRMLYSDGSSVDVFLKKDFDSLSGFTLSDCGNTETLLRNAGVSTTKTRARRRLEYDLYVTYGVKQNRGDLECQLESLKEDLAHGVLMLAQACIQISTLINHKR